MKHKGILSTISFYFHTWFSLLYVVQIYWSTFFLLFESGFTSAEKVFNFELYNRMQGFQLFLYSSFLLCHIYYSFFSPMFYGFDTHYMYTFMYYVGNLYLIRVGFTCSVIMFGGMSWTIYVSSTDINHGKIAPFPIIITILCYCYNNAMLECSL